MAELSDRERIEALEQEIALLRDENAQLKLTEADAKPRRPFPWRVFWSRLFVVLGLVVIIPASLLIWLNRTITDTDRYIATIGPIISEPAVQKAITQVTTTSIFDQVNIEQEVTKLLPDQAKILAGPISGQVEGFITKSVGTIVASQQFATLWVNVNREAQIKFMQVAEGSGNPVIDINRLYGFVSVQLQDTPLAPLAGKELPPSIGTIQVANVPALEKIPHFVATLDALRWLFFGLSLACLALAMAIAADRRRVTILIGLGWMLSVVVTFIVVRVTRGMMLDQIADPVYKDAALAVWQALLKPFGTQSAVLLLSGAAVATTGWLLGPSRPAVAFRSGSQSFLGGARTNLFPGLETTAFTAWLRRYHHPLLWTLLAVGIVVMLINVPLTPVVLAWILGGELLGLVILEFLVAPAPATAPQLPL